MIVVAVLYSGGYMMSESQLTVGDLTSFLLYTVYVGMSIAGKRNVILISYCSNLTRSPGNQLIG